MSHLPGIVAEDSKCAQAMRHNQRGTTKRELDGDLFFIIHGNDNRTPPPFRIATVASRRRDRFALRMTVARARRSTQRE
jgi:hypothetical protein